MRLIDADELIPLIKMGEMNTYDDLGRGRNGGIAFAIERINQMPTIEPKKGKWEEKNHFAIDEETDSAVIDEWQEAKCSVCGKWHTTPYLYYFNNYDWCPNCGSRMSK